MTKRLTFLEVGKFAFYVFVPIGVLYFVDSRYFQETYVKPYTLYPNSHKTLDDRPDFPIRANKEEQEKWLEEMRATAPIRKRAKEIYQQRQEEKQQQRANDTE